MSQLLEQEQGGTGSLHVMDTQCPFCIVQCKMQVIEERGSVEGRPTYSVVPKQNAASEGRLCIKGMNAWIADVVR